MSRLEELMPKIQAYAEAYADYLVADGINEERAANAEVVRTKAALERALRDALEPQEPILPAEVEAEIGRLRARIHVLTLRITGDPVGGIGLHVYDSQVVLGMGMAAMGACAKVAATLAAAPKEPTK